MNEGLILQDTLPFLFAVFFYVVLRVSIPRKNGSSNPQRLAYVFLSEPSSQWIVVQPSPRNVRPTRRRHGFDLDFLPGELLKYPEAEVSRSMCLAVMMEMISIMAGKGVWSGG